ncbi:MAG: helix-turn-helix transcriptional regulator [Synergistaceae bacterium]|nr:helix-turn-helix transcriptional regulator [Synergistaceae bacterium]
MSEVQSPEELDEIFRKRWEQRLEQLEQLEQMLPERLRELEQIDFNTLDKLCRHFGCAVADLLLYLPDDEKKGARGGRTSKNINPSLTEKSSFVNINPKKRSE